jgi:hypothetical protein
MGNSVTNTTPDDEIPKTIENETVRDSVTPVKRTFSFISKLRKSRENNNNKPAEQIKLDTQVVNNKYTDVQKSIIYTDNRCKKRLFLKNEFYNIDKYVKTIENDYLVRDLERYENNLKEETKSIENIYSTIYISKDVNLKEQFELEMKKSLDLKLASINTYLI